MVVLARCCAGRNARVTVEIKGSAVLGKWDEHRHKWTTLDGRHYIIRVKPKEYGDPGAWKVVTVFAGKETVICEKERYSDARHKLIELASQ